MVVVRVVVKHWWNMGVALMMVVVVLVRVGEATTNSNMIGASHSAGATLRDHDAHDQGLHTVVVVGVVVVVVVDHWWRWWWWVKRKSMKNK